MNAVIALKGRRDMWQDIYVREKLRDLESERVRRYAVAGTDVKVRAREVSLGGLWRRIAGALSAATGRAGEAGRNHGEPERVRHLGVAPGERGVS